MGTGKDRVSVGTWLLLVIVTIMMTAGAGLLAWSLHLETQERISLRKKDESRRRLAEARRKIEHVKRHFVDQLREAFLEIPRLTPDEQDEILELIHENVEHENVTWDDLGFSEDDLVERIRLSRVKLARKLFANMLSAEGVCHAEFVASTILDIVYRGVTWDELGFTRERLVLKVRVAHKWVGTGHRSCRGETDL